MIEKIEEAAGPLAGKTAAVLGLSFKPETDDIRESPALAVVADLVEAGVSVRAFDPAAMENTRAVLPRPPLRPGRLRLRRRAPTSSCSPPSGTSSAPSTWRRSARALRARTMIDLRNVYDPKELRAAGWSYTGVGRP